MNCLNFGEVYKLIIAVMAFCTLGATTSQAQVDVTVNPIGLLFGDLSAGVDFVLADNFSVEGTVGLGISNKELLGYKATNIPISAFGKYYFNPNNGADKFYASVWLRFISRGVDWNEDFIGGTNVNYSQTRFGVGLGIGYKIVSDGGIVFDIGFGAGRALFDNTTFDDSTSDPVTIDWPQIMFNGKLGVGYRFGG